ncbi:hypothetical protein HYT23_06320 [Candidatus Pacearchaeota archaeon]|nr:hypothetical protein [Candidatus Pacearchaeota archaeon]
MLTNEKIRQIEEFVYEKPRSIQEIAEYLKKNWRTADRYVREIIENNGTISSKTFREGTRGALKIVYWTSMEKRASSVFQEDLEKQILNAKRKEDFSAFDIFQHIDDKNKRVTIEEKSSEETTNLKELAEIIKQTKKELISLSGNLSYINLKNKSCSIFDELENLIKGGVRIKALCRIDISGKENIEKLLSLNFKYGKELVEIRHYEHPMRAFIIDKKIIRLKEIKEPTGKMHELNKKLFIFYTIRDKNWAEWIASVFLKMFNKSIGAEKRLQELNKIFV